MIYRRPRSCALETDPRTDATGACKGGDDSDHVWSMSIKKVARTTSSSSARWSTSVLETPPLIRISLQPSETCIKVWPTTWAERRYRTTHMSAGRSIQTRRVSAKKGTLEIYLRSNLYCCDTLALFAKDTRRVIDYLLYSTISGVPR